MTKEAAALQRAIERHARLLAVRQQIDAELAETKREIANAKAAVLRVEAAERQAVPA